MDENQLYKSCIPHPLPYHIEERLALEFYGSIFIEALKKVSGEEPDKLYPYSSPK